MKIDLSKNGFESIFTDWQIEILHLLTANPGREWTSNILHTEMFDTAPVSRASVIGFMKLLETWGVIQVTYDKGQGGPYRIYKCNYTMDELWVYIKSLAQSWLNVSDKILSSTKTVKGDKNED